MCSEKERVNEVVEKYSCAKAFLPHLPAYLRGEQVVPFEIEIQPSSDCNLKCDWCIGNNEKGRLPNAISADNLDLIVDGILDLKIPSVMFSGYNGEPMLKQSVLIGAMERLVEAGVRVGLFTNGTIPLKTDSIRVLSKIDYVHVSLDAGPRSYASVKEGIQGRDLPSRNFVRAIETIEILSENGATVNVGYVMTPRNAEDIFRTTGLCKDAGAKSIRFKCDISANHSFEAGGILDEAYEDLDAAIDRFHEEGVFEIKVFHTKEDILDRSYLKWDKSKGCHFQNFFATIGSNGCSYLCDHNTGLDDLSLGNATKRPLRDIWTGPARQVAIDNIESSCKSDVCPPFGNEANLFIQEILDLSSEIGIEETISQLLERNE